MFVELLLTIGAIIVFSVFAIRPTLVTIGGLTTEIGGKEDTVKQMDTKIDAILAAQTVFANESSRLALLDTAVPPQPNIDEYVHQIEQIANKDNVKVSVLTSGGIPLTDTTADGSERSFTVSFTLAGNYDALKTAMQDVENLRRPLQLVEWGISLDESQDSGQLLLSLKGAIPYFPIPLLNF